MNARSNAAALCTLAALLAACDTADPTQAVVDDQYADIVVYKAWWVVSLFPDPVAPRQSSKTNRVVPGDDYAYALLAPGWDPASSTPPSTLVPLRTKTRIAVARGDTLRIAISDATVDGNCAAGSFLSSDDARFITDRIFPGDFVGLVYDPATCTAAPLDDGGVSYAGD